MYVIVWEFEAAEGREPEFEEAYGGEGIWVQFFRRGDGYAGSELLHNCTKPRVYATLDRWQSAAQYEAFRRQNITGYQAIDKLVRTSRSASATSAITKHNRDRQRLPL